MLKRLLHLTALGAFALSVGCKDDEIDPRSRQYDIEIRFFGANMSATQQQLFTNAAARLQQIIKGDLINAAAPNPARNLNECPNVTDNIPLQEEVDDVIIYASIKPIDGNGRILASASPCFTRPTSSGSMTAYGVMVFDVADTALLRQGGNLQDVITHEMMHVLGVGTLWVDHNLIADTGTATPRYLGALARAGCLAVGGTTACAQHVPVEGTPEPVGTRDAHWKEQTFNTEIMTGFLDPTTPISKITIGALRDLGFNVDTTQADAYTMPAAGFAVSNPASAVLGRNFDWEQLGHPVGSLVNGRFIPAVKR